MTGFLKKGTGLNQLLF